MAVIPNSSLDTLAAQEKRNAALSSVWAAILLTSIKIVVGLLTGSLGILAEAAHSALDLVAAMITFFAVRISSRSPDRRYTYGYGKVENLSALFETLLLLLTCAWIIYEAIQRLFFSTVEIEASIWAFLVMGVSIVVDVSRSRLLKRVADKYGSQALEADALHFSTDIWSSSVVITGLVLVWIANMVELPILVKADALAAIGVAGIVIYVSLRLGKKTISDLLDAIPPGLREAIIQSIRQVPGIQSIERVRVRRSGPEFFADISLSVRRELALERAHDTATQVEIAINQIIPGADVVINMLPVATADEEITTQVRMLAARQGLSIHGIRIYDVLGKRSMELHLEVPDTLNLEQAHTKATDFETALKTAIPDLTEVITHIEPVGDAAVMRAGTPFDENQVKQVVLDITREMGAECHPHDLKVSRVDGEFAVSFHCVINGEQLITEAHKLTERFEAAMRARIPRLGRVTIHVEPPNAASL